MENSMEDNIIENMSDEEKIKSNSDTEVDSVANSIKTIDVELNMASDSSADSQNASVEANAENSEEKGEEVVKESKLAQALNIFSNKAKDLIVDYGKIAGSAVVIMIMCVVCIVSLVVRADSNKNLVGVMMTLSDYSDSVDTFEGRNLEAQITPFEQVLYVNSVANSEASKEQSGVENVRTVDEIIAAQKKSKNDKAYIEAKSVKRMSAEIGIYDPNEKKKPSISTIMAINGGGTTNTIASGGKPVEKTTADPNGEYEDMGTFLITGYCPCVKCCGQWSDMDNPKTYSGTTPVQGRTVAADLSVFPIGTKLMINGQIYVVEDIGGAINGKHLDMYFNNHQDAWNWGTRYFTVYRVK